jgi:LmbE family N-acetylglucosaminyl deacetylase
VTGDDVVFVLAHQDDEAGAIATIVRERNAGHRCWFLYLTDGGRYTSSIVRDAETCAALARVGIDRSCVVFLADGQGRIADGSLVNDLARAEAMLTAWLRKLNIAPARVYTIDWEGGHVDHDAAHLVALSFARQRNVTIAGFSLYNGYRRLRKILRLRVTALVPSDGHVLSFAIPWRTALLAASAPLWYPSQRSSWRSLGPGLAVRVLVGRQERLRSASVRRVEKRPHNGKLLYETLFGVPYEQFERSSRAYRETLSMKNVSAAPSAAADNA